MTGDPRRDREGDHCSLDWDHSCPATTWRPSPYRGVGHSAGKTVPFVRPPSAGAKVSCAPTSMRSGRRQAPSRWERSTRREPRSSGGETRPARYVDQLAANARRDILSEDREHALAVGTTRTEAPARRRVAYRRRWPSAKPIAPGPGERDGAHRRDEGADARRARMRRAGSGSSNTRPTQ